MKPALRVVALLPVIALSLGGWTYAGVAVKEQREEKRALASAAAEAKAVAEYQRGMRPVLNEVFDAVQPLHDLQDSFAEVLPMHGLIRNDVLARTGAAAVLRKQTKVFEAVRVPRVLRPAHKDLSIGLDDLVAAVDALAAATRARPDTSGHVAEFSQAFAKLDASSTDWQVATGKVYGQIKVPTPAPLRGGANGRPVRSRGSYVLEADKICGRLEVDYLALGERPKEFNAKLDHATKIAAILRTAITGLQKVPAHRADRTRLNRDVGAGLKAVLVFPDTLDGMVVAGRKGDLPALRALDIRLRQTLPRMRDLARAYRNYGATLCADAFDTGPLTKGDAPVRA